MAGAATPAMSRVSDAAETNFIIRSGLSALETVASPSTEPTTARPRPRSLTQTGMVSPVTRKPQRKWRAGNDKAAELAFGGLLRIDAQEGEGWRRSLQPRAWGEGRARGDRGEIGAGCDQSRAGCVVSRPRPAAG